MTDFTNQLLEGTALEGKINPDSTSFVGEHFQTLLTDALAAGDTPDSFVLGLTPKRVMLVSTNYETNEQRCQVCRYAGRYFAGVASDANEQVLFIGTTSASNQSSRKDVRPGEDPYRQDVAVTTIQNLAPCYEATDVTSLARALNVSPYLFYPQRLHDGLIVETYSDGKQVVGADEYEALTEEEKETKTTLHNSLLNDCFIGVTSIFPLVKQMTESGELATAWLK